MAGVGRELDPHVVGERLVAGQQLRADIAVTGTEEGEGGARQPLMAPTAAGALSHGPLVVAVELHDRVRPSRLPKAVDVKVKLFLGERGSNVSAAQNSAGDPRPLEDGAAEPGGGDHPRVPAPPELEEDSRREA